MSDENTIVENDEARDEQIRRVMRSVKSTYLTSPRDALLEAEIDVLIEQAEEIAWTKSAAPEKAVGRLGEGRALVVVGSSGAGKTRSLDRLFSKKKAFQAENDASPLIRVTAPSPCTLRLLGQGLASELGYHTERDLKENVAWDMVRKFLAYQKVRHVHIDELQHLSQTRNPIEAAKVQNTLKGLMQSAQWPVCLILSGLPVIESLIKGDPQLLRRSRFVRLPSLSFHEHADDIRGIVKGLGRQKAGLSVGNVVTDEVVSRLLHAAMQQMGILIEYVQDAVRKALKEGSSELEIKHFASVYRARTGCCPDENVFTCKGDWTLLNVAGVPISDNAAAHSTNPGRGASTGRARRRK